MKPVILPFGHALRRSLYLGIWIGCIALCAHLARLNASEELKFRREMAAIAVKAPRSTPPLTQESIDLALVMFGIEVPPGAMHPELDRELRDRGLTARGAFMDKARVTVGPAAFSSWGLLGSTLAHELEVHCRQNFMMIYVFDALGLDGTGNAEREAYIHELRNAGRFGLARPDADLIADTMEFYYPDNGPSVVPKSVRRWLARNLLRPSSSF